MCAEHFLALRVLEPERDRRRGRLPRMEDRLTKLLGCELPIQLAPMGSVSVTASLPLAVADAGGHAVYPALALPPPAVGPVLDARSTGGLSA